MPARPADVDTVIIGAGQSGLAMSYYLRGLDIEHVILERGRVGERWLTERWDSLRLQGPGWTVALPGSPYDSDDLDEFPKASEFAAFLARYARDIRAPVRSGVSVTSVSATSEHRWTIETEDYALAAANVVVATGAFELPAIPPLAASFPPGMLQIPATRFQNAALLPDGKVLVVGSGASGCQILEDLLAAGRDVLLSVGAHNRLPRRYRGMDTEFWLRELGEFDRSVDSLVSVPKKSGPGQLMTGVGGGHTIDIRDYALAGVTLLGRLTGIDGRVAQFDDEVDTILQRGDVMFDRFRRAVDFHVRSNGLDFPEEELVMRAPGYEPTTPPKSIDLAASGVSTVIWATGQRRHHPWLTVPVFDEHGMPKHKAGVTEFAGLYFLGLTWQRKLQSTFIAGVGEDAEVLAREFGRRR